MFTPAKQQTDLHTAFGQYLAHDLAHSAPKACPIEAWPIPNPKDTDIQKTIPFQRSKHSSEGPNQPREQFSAVSAFIDGSAIYGTNEAFTDKLRSFQDGLLKVDDMDLPPRGTKSPGAIRMVNALRKDEKKLRELGEPREWHLRTLQSFAEREGKVASGRNG